MLRWTTKWINCLDSDNPVKNKKWSGAKPSHFLEAEEQYISHLKMGGKKPTGVETKKRSKDATRKVYIVLNDMEKTGEGCWENFQQ